MNRRFSSSSAAAGAAASPRPPQGPPARLLRLRRQSRHPLKSASGSCLPRPLGGHSPRTGQKFSSSSVFDRSLRQSARPTASGPLARARRPGDGNPSEHSEAPSGSAEPTPPFLLDSVSRPRRASRGGGPPTQTASRTAARTDRRLGKGFVLSVIHPLWGIPPRTACRRAAAAAWWGGRAGLPFLRRAALAPPGADRPGGRGPRGDSQQRRRPR